MFQSPPTSICVASLVNKKHLGLDLGEPGVMSRSTVFSETASRKKIRAVLQCRSSHALMAREYLKKLHLKWI